MKTEIIYEDKSILVCRKPSGIAVQTAKIGEQDVVSELKNYLAGTSKGYRGYLGIVHRLDQPVDGLLVFAKTPDAAAGLTRQLGDQKSGNQSFNKEYVAVVFQSGEHILPLKGTLVNEIAKSKDNRAVIRDAAEGEGNLIREKQNSQGYKKAVLHYEMTHLSLGKTGTDRLFLAKIKIDTGRFHQIRAQMSYAGFPIVGDLKYGNDESVIFAKKMGIRQVLLCANKLSFCHPVTSQRLEYEVTPGDAFFIP